MGQTTATPDPGANDTARLREEIRELRRLVDRGDSLAIAGGKMCAWWGFVIAVGALADALIAWGRLTPKIPVNGLVLLVGYGGTLVLPRIGARSRFLGTWRTQAISTSWIFAGLGVSAFFLGSNLSGRNDHASVTACIAIIFGIMLAVVATSSRQSGLLVAAVGWMAAGFSMFFLNSEAARMLTFGMAAIVFLFIPGLALARGEKRAQQ